MRLLMLIAAATAIASCSRPVMMSDRSDAAELLAGRSAGPVQSCISTNASEGLRILDAQTIAYGRGRTVFVNRLASACPGLRPLSTIIVEAGNGAQYCRGDRVRGIETGAIIPGPSCNLGDWVPYTRP